MEAAARLSPDGVYRYTLMRRWEPWGPALRWIMLNPSTADAREDDPTIRRVVEFSRREGYAACVVANLFALRATDPRAITLHPYAVGPWNNETLGQVSRAATQDAYQHGKEAIVVVAWGARAPAERVQSVVHGPLAAVKLMCLGRTKNGAPRHPLYVSGTTPLERWR
jgi:hypothetical protein